MARQGPACLWRQNLNGTLKRLQREIFGREMMELSFAAPHAVGSGAWVVAALDGSVLTPAAQKADKAAGGALSRALKVSKFTGKSGQVLEILAPAALGVARILLVGLGKGAEF